jgi:hypothetical protein
MSSKTIQVGDKVRFRIGGRSVVGEVREDCGPIGLNGRHLYRVRYEMGKDNWYITELPAVQMEVIEEEPA